MTVEEQIEIAAGPEAVYRLVMDPDRLGEWVSIHEGLERSPGRELAVGTEMTQRLKVAGRRFRVRWKVTEDECPERVVWEGRGPAGTRARVEYRFEPDGDRTWCRYVNAYELPGGPAGKLAGRAVAGAARREVKRSLRRLKGLLE